MNSRRPLIIVLAVLWAVSATRGSAGPESRPTPKKYARPPQWSHDVLDAFFDDAREKLVGARPDYGRPVGSPGRGGPHAGDLDAARLAASTGIAWSKLIDAETLESEIKRLAQDVENDVATPSGFKGGTYKDCRRHFSVLAMLFAITAEYDGEARWKDVAPPLRDVFARAGRNCKVGTDQTFQEASQRKLDLADLVRGSRPQVSAGSRDPRTTKQSGDPRTTGEAEWAQVADRPPLMQRLNIAHEERLTKWLADERQFAQRGDAVRHEAQVAAGIAEFISRRGYEFAGDEQYAEYARALRQAASDLAAAVEQQNFQQARQAIDRATNACTNCHAGYRG